MSTYKIISKKELDTDDINKNKFKFAKNILCTIYRHSFNSYKFYTPWFKAVIHRDYR